MVAKATLLIATTNRGKLREVRAILTGLPVKLATLADHPGLAVPIEDADTFEGNAQLKALHYARLTKCWTLADDSGLEVDVLRGQPGVHSARYAGPQCDPAANNTKLIQKLANVPLENRTARFRCAMALASPTEVVATTSGTVEGLIIDEARGSKGFGYDPHFLVPRDGLTTAEMPPEQKNRISHRGQALAAMRPEIVRHVCNPPSPARDDHGSR